MTQERTSQERSSSEPLRSGPRDDDLNRAAGLDEELQSDPVLQDGRAGSGRVTLVAIGIALVLGVVFYGLNNTSVQEPTTPTQTAQMQTPPSHAPTKNPNAAPGVTTGAAPSHPTPPAPSPTGSTAPQNNASH